MTSETFFRLISYLAVFCGFLSLWVSGTFGIVGTVLFIALMVGAWQLEGSRWQISERAGTALIVLSLPAFYLIWRLQLITLYGGETALAGILARMILALTCIKLLQRKSDRDWIFLYLMAFFEVLLAAGLSISALYFGSFVLYLVVMVCTIITFEIRKTSFSVEMDLAAVESKKKDQISEPSSVLPVRRLPTTAIVLIVFIVGLAVPLFFMLPRVGGAGFGGDQAGFRTFSGFSDTVKLGNIGRIQQSDGIAMRVKFEDPADATSDLYFRGIVLDTFDNISWSKSKRNLPSLFVPGDRDQIVVDTVPPDRRLTKQTVYLEPMDSDVIFAMPRAVAIGGNFPFINRDAYGSLRYKQSFERISYTAYSDLSSPPIDKLRADNAPYTADLANYRDLPPRYDHRIAELAATVTAKARNRYDKAAAVENYLQTNFAYTLELKSSGTEPLADFLFNVREGHCEYFASAMAIMLRTQGLATRIANGFHGGEYNDAAGVTVVRQRNAHAWVEVYFPGEDAWVRFDPTPASGDGGIARSAGFVGAVNKYIEALETFWIQNFVAYDNQEQRSLARTVRTGFLSYQQQVATLIGRARDLTAEWLSELRGDKGLAASRTALIYGIAYFLAAALGICAIWWLAKRIMKLDLWRRLRKRLFAGTAPSIVEFYDRMLSILAQKGLVRESHQTPLEFANSTGSSEVLAITKLYNGVRFGERRLSSDQVRAVDDLLRQLAADGEGRV